MIDDPGVSEAPLLIKRMVPLLSRWLEASVACTAAVAANVGLVGSKLTTLWPCASISTEHAPMLVPTSTKRP